MSFDVKVSMVVKFQNVRWITVCNKFVTIYKNDFFDTVVAFVAFYFNIPIVKMVNKYAEKTSVITATATASGISLYSIIDLAVVLDAKAATSRW